jgi:hypothetical protein
MIVTNLHGLPLPLVRAVENDPYDRGDADISVTQLIRPPRQVELERLHKDELTEDASDRIWALCGQIGHLILERAANVGMTEHRLAVTRLGWKISCAVDLWDKQWVCDYKFCSGWAIKDGPKKEWIEQTNMQRLIAIENGFDVTNIQIVAILRDWSVMEAKRNPDFPQSQVQVYNLPIWSKEEAEEWLIFAVLGHQAARRKLPECTAAERWERPTKFAVKKNGAKRALKLYDTMDEAMAALPEKGHAIEKRPGEQVRCENYCSVAQYCDFYQRLKTENQELEQSIEKEA